MADKYNVLEYIQSTGTQFILTDIPIVASNKYVADIQLTEFLNYMTNSASYIFGSNAYFVQFGTNRDKSYASFILGTGWNGSGYQIVGVRNITSRGILTAKRGTATCSWLVTNAGIQTASSAAPIIYDTLGELEIFGRPASGAYSSYEMRLYSFKIYDSSNNLAGDLVPVERQSDGEAGLFDRLTQSFYPNAGAGAFVKGSATGEVITVLSQGAFTDASQLAKVRIPSSVKRIGELAFSGTQLTSVKIAHDCEFAETSFPAGCEVTYYTSDGSYSGDYGQLLDCDGKIVLDKSAARVYVRE